MPDDFPLAAGLPDTNGDDGSPVEVTDVPTWSDVELCGEIVWSRAVPVPVTDLAGASYTGEAEDSRSRLLALYADDQGAQQALDTLSEAYLSCPDGAVGGTDQVYEVVESHVGLATVTHRYRTEGQFDTGLEVIEIVVFGNALYLSSYYSESGASEESITAGLAFAARSSQPVYNAMQVFTDAPVPADDTFPLTQGWPEDVEPGEPGIEFPVDTVDPTFAGFTCGREAPADDVVDTLRARLSNLEQYRTRELLTFHDADAAVAYVAALDRFFAACPLMTEDDLSYPVARVEAGVGGQSFGLVRRTEYAGEPAIGSSALLVVRVGSAVLLDTTSGEGSGGRDPMVQARADVEAMARDSAGVVEAMCSFTEAGCPG